jgi:hypothetical protein
MEASDDPVSIAEKCLKENLPDIDYNAIDACAKVISFIILIYDSVLGRYLPSFEVLLKKNQKN